MTRAHTDQKKDIRLLSILHISLGEERLLVNLLIHIYMFKRVWGKKLSGVEWSGAERSHGVESWSGVKSL